MRRLFLQWFNFGFLRVFFLEKGRTSPPESVDSFVLSPKTVSYNGRSGGTSLSPFFSYLRNGRFGVVFRHIPLLFPGHFHHFIDEFSAFFIFLGGKFLFSPFHISCQLFREASKVSEFPSFCFEFLPGQSFSSVSSFEPFFFIIIFFSGVRVNYDIALDIFLARGFSPETPLV